MICAYIVSYIILKAILVYIIDLQNTCVLKNTIFSILTQKACELQIDMFFFMMICWYLDENTYLHGDLSTLNIEKIFCFLVISLLLLVQKYCHILKKLKKNFFLFYVGKFVVHALWSHQYLWKLIFMDKVKITVSKYLNSWPMILVSIQYNN